MQKSCLTSDVVIPYILWGNSANGVMPPMPRCRLYQCRFNARLCPMRDLKHENVFYLTPSSFPEMKSTSFSIIPWHSKFCYKHKASVFWESESCFISIVHIGLASVTEIATKHLF